ncbi:MAG: hypothetical protein DRN06_05355 [Thermoprotei archaeon]|nr:MAG: hypothetical protein DRN06_05355 [Thermoprotei archaeon]
MPVLLRVDCDNGYVPLGSWPIRKLKLALNYLNENYYAPHLPGFLEHFYALISRLEEAGVTASIFFKYITLPPRKYAEWLVSRGFELGLHLLSAGDYEGFIREKRLVERRVGRILGFTKHGDGRVKLSRRHYWRYEPEKYVRWGIRSGLKYFSGNVHAVITEVEVMKGFLYFPSVFCVEPWRRKASVREAAERANSGFVVVALVHPRNWVLTPQTRSELEELLTLVGEVITFREFISKFNL